MTLTKFCSLPKLINEIKELKETSEELEGIVLAPPTQDTTTIKIQKTFNTGNSYIIDKVLDTKQMYMHKIRIITEIHTEILDLISTLPEQERKILELRHIKGYSFNRISKIIGVSRTTAMRVHTKALNMLIESGALTE